MMLREPVRTILSTIVLALLPLTASAADIEWRTDALAAWNEAAEKGWPLLMFVTMQGCPHCVQMERGTFAASDVTAQVEGGFVPLLLDSRQNVRYVQKLRVKSFPAILIASPDRKLLVEARGYQTPAKFKKLLRSAQERNEKEELARRR